MDQVLDDEVMVESEGFKNQLEEQQNYDERVISVLETIRRDQSGVEG